VVVPCFHICAKNLSLSSSLLLYGHCAILFRSILLSVGFWGLLGVGISGNQLPFLDVGLLGLLGVRI
jgi:hypothetical protein